MGEPGGGGLTWEMRLALTVAAVASAYLGSTVLRLRGVSDALVFVLAFPAWVAAHAVAGVLERGGSMWVELQRWKGRRDRGSSSGARKASGREVRHMAILVEQERVSIPDGSRKVPPPAQTRPGQQRAPATARAAETRAPRSPTRLPRWWRGRSRRRA